MFWKMNDKKKKRTMSLELAALQAKHNHSIKILLLYAIIIVVTIGPFVLIGRNSKNEMEYWWMPIVVYICLLCVITILLIAALKQNKSFIIRKLDARLITEKEKPELLKTVRCFSDKAKNITPTVYLTEKNCVTILSAGWSPQKSILVFSSKAIEILEKDELDSIVAHEICHIQSYDYLLRVIMFASAGILFNYCYGVAQICICNSRELLRDIMGSSKWHRIFSDKSFIYLPSLLLVVPILSVCAWVIGIPMKRVMAEQEYRADLGSVQITGNPSVLARAIAKLALAWQTPIDDSAEFFMLFDIAKPSCRNKIQQKLFDFFQSSVTERAVKRANKLNNIRELLRDDGQDTAENQISSLQ